MLKFPHFRCHGMKGPSEICFNDIVKSPDAENLFGARIPTLFFLSRVIPIFMPKFITHGGHLGKYAN